MRMVATMDELIGTAIFNKPFKAGFPSIASLDGVRYSVKRTRRRANAEPSAAGFGGIRREAREDTEGVA